MSKASGPELLQTISPSYKERKGVREALSVEEQGEVQPQQPHEEEIQAGEVRPRTRRSPKEPTNEEILGHKITHTPYRSWCPECVKARAKANPHMTQEKQDKAVATIHID